VLQRGEASVEPDVPLQPRRAGSYQHDLVLRHRRVLMPGEDHRLAEYGRPRRVAGEDVTQGGEVLEVASRRHLDPLHKLRGFDVVVVLVDVLPGDLVREECSWPA